MYTFSDLTYVLFPISIIWRLNMPPRTKVYLCLLMSMSLVTMAASMMKIISGALVAGRDAHKHRDVQWDASLSKVWTGLEQTLVIIMGCAPALYAASKTNLPRLRSISSSLARLVRFAPRASTDEAPSAQKNSRNPLYVNPEVQSGEQNDFKSHAAHWNIIEGPSPAYMMQKRGTRFGSDEGFRRTDHHSVDIERRMNPATNV